MKPDGTYQLLADKYEGKCLNSPNEVLLGPDGALYFTNPTLDLVKGEKQEIPFQGVYRLAADGSLRLLIKDLSQPNGLAFSPDGHLACAWIASAVYINGPLGIWVWSPQGKHLGTIVLPEMPANLIWGDAGYNTLYITATTSVYRLKTKARRFVPYE